MATFHSLVRLFRTPRFSGAQVAAFGISASLFASWLDMTFSLQQILGLSAIEAGLVPRGLAIESA